MKLKKLLLPFLESKYGLEKPDTPKNGYEVPEIGDEVKTENGWKKLVKIEEFTGVEDCYDFVIEAVDGKIINNYFANGTLVQGSY